MTTRGTRGSGRRPDYLQPVPAPPVELDAAFDFDPVELIEPIYADLAHDVGVSRDPLEVECGIAEWLAMTAQMIRSGVPDDEGDRAVASFLGSLIEVARRHATPQALALLRALSVLPGTASAEVAGAAAAELATSGIADRAWVAKLGRLQPTSCLRYGDIDGRQESLIAGFSYGRTEHAIVVLIDHDLGGGIKDCWVTDRPELARQQILTTVVSDPLVEVAPIDWVRAERILSAALSRPICAVGDDQVIDASANIAVLRRRVGVLNGESWRPAGHRAPTRRLSSANQDSLFGDAPQTAAAPTAPKKTAVKKTAVKKTAEPRPGRSLASLQLKVTLTGSKPPIWRRLRVPESTTLVRLHELIQIAFGWTDSHLHLFEVHGEEYGPTDEWVETRSENIRLSRLVAVGDRFSYVYDFGDDWRHTIQFEKRLPAGSGDGTPCCIAGRRAGPPENCGGIYGYQELLDVIANPERADEELLSWAAETLGTTTAQLPAYDPARFDQGEINAALLDLRR